MTLREEQLAGPRMLCWAIVSAVATLAAVVITCGLM